MRPLIRALLPLLLVAAPLCAQTTVSVGRVQTVYTGGPSVCNQGLAKSAGTTGTGAAMSDPTHLVGCWDLGKTSTLIKGAYTATWNGTNYADRTGTPVTGYPCTMGGWVRVTSTTVARLIEIDDASNLNRFLVFYDGTRFDAYTAASGSAGQAAAASTSGTGWHFVVGTFTDATHRAVFVDGSSNTGTNTTNLTPATLTTLRVGTDASGSAGTSIQGLLFLYPGIASTAQIDAMAKGYDPQLVLGSTCQVWPMDNSLVSRSGSYDLTSHGTLTAQNNLLVVRDQASGNHVTAIGVNSAPTYSASQGNGQGGGAFARAFAQYLKGTPPTTGAATQAYVVGQRSGVSSTFLCWQPSSPGSTDFFWFGGDAVGIYWQAYHSGAGGTASYLTAPGTNDHLFYGAEYTSTSRATQFDGGTPATDTTSVVPASLARFFVGAYDLSTLFFQGQQDLILIQNTTTTFSQTAIQVFTDAAYSLGF